MNQFEIINKTKEKLDNVEDIYNVLNYTLQYLKVNNSIFNIIIVSEEEIKKINKEYRNKDYVTDVISFALEDDDTFIKTEFRVLGDIYICFNKAKSQAIEYNHSFKREICFLSVHGLLHLLGFDHMNVEDEKIMFGLQDKILEDCDIKR